MTGRFSEILKESLAKKGMSLRELARRTGLDVSFYSKILSGYRNPPSNESDIKKIAIELDIVPEKLILAAGRIPESLYSYLNSEDLLRVLVNKSKNFGSVSMLVKAKKASVKPRPKTEDKGVYPKSVIEDELL